MATLRPRARIIRTIGDQLISGPDAALIELVKNAFDADSPIVKIKIVPRSQQNPKGLVIVKDLGHGMTYTDIVERWFEPATDEKQKRRLSPGGRLMLGAKGIGRFAVSRLGTQTKLRSVAELDEHHDEEVVVDINWNAFTADKYLEEIDIPVTKLKLSKNSTKTGVELRISDLRDEWKPKKIESLVRELRRLAYHNESDDSFQIHLDLSDFTKETSGFDGAALMQEINTDVTDTDNENADPTIIVPFRVQSHADYKLTGEFSSTGAFHGLFTISKGDSVPQPISVPAPAQESEQSLCGAVNIQINVYDRESDSIEALFTRMGMDFEKIGIRVARKILNENAGIAIFRNGFRIRPYGEPENDWLELERQRVQNPSRKLGLSQVSGRIDIQSESESRLIERSSREGLEHNDAFDRLKQLIQEVLTHIEERRYAFREKAGLSRKMSGDVEKLRNLASLKAVSKAVANLPSRYQQPMLSAIARDSSELATSIEEIDAYQKILQSRASLGLVVAQVIHEGRRILNPMSTAAKSLITHKDWLLEDTARGKLARKQFPEQAETIDTGTKNLSRLFKRLDPVSGRRRGKPSDFSPSGVVSASLALFKTALADAEIMIDADVSSSIRLHGYVDDFQSALMNIVENAIHWLCSTDNYQRRISIWSTTSESVAQIHVSNNGPIIDDSYLPRLFQPGFSLKSEGTGLGLAIAREACRASKGELVYDHNEDDTTFIIEFPLT